MFSMFTYFPLNNCMRNKWQAKTHTLQNRKLNVIQWFSKMPGSCCAVGCSNRRSKGSTLKFYRIPFGSDDKSLKLRKKWVTAIKQDKWTEKQIDNARICSAYFFVRYSVYYFMLGIIRCEFCAFF